MAIELNFYNTDKIAGLNLNTLKRIAKCYRQVFNAYWQDEWTDDSALKQVTKSLTITKSKKPLLALIEEQKEVFGFAWAVITSVENINTDDMPFDVSEEKKQSGVDVLKYWCKLAEHDKVLIFRELGIKKSYHNIQGQHSASRLYSYIGEAAMRAGCKVLFYWTSPDTPIFGQCLGMGWHPVYFYTEENLVVMKGDIGRMVDFAKRVLNKDKKVFPDLIEGYERYFCK